MNAVAPRRWRVCSLLISASIVATSLGCAGSTSYVPQHVAPGELILRYDGGIQVYAGREQLTEGPRYTDLHAYVRCVPQAADHAERAAKHGEAGVGLAWSGGVMGALSLASLGGLTVIEDQPEVGFAILGTGLVVGAIAVSLAASSRTQRNQAHGNALDAINYYNDAVGSTGASCATVDRSTIVAAPLPTGPLPPLPPAGSVPERRGPDKPQRAD